MSAAWSKLEEYAARLALVIHCVGWAAGEAASDAAPIDAASMSAGVLLTEWFKYEARRVYALLSETSEEAERRRLVEWLERRGGVCTAREAQQGCRWLISAEEAERALEELVRAGWARWEPSPAGLRGQPTRRCVLLPAVYGNGENIEDQRNTVDVDGTGLGENHIEADEWGEV